MATEITTTVDIPPHTVCVPSGKYKYIYLTKKTYRKGNAGIRNDRICIGKMSEDGKMIPNLNYYKEFNETMPHNFPDVIRSAVRCWKKYSICTVNEIV